MKSTIHTQFCAFKKCDFRKKGQHAAMLNSWPEMDFDLNSLCAAMNIDPAEIDSTAAALVRLVEARGITSASIVARMVGCSERRVYQFRFVIDHGLPFDISLFEQGRLSFVEMQDRAKNSKLASKRKMRKSALSGEMVPGLQAMKNSINNILVKKRGAITDSEFRSRACAIRDLVGELKYFKYMAPTICEELDAFIVSQLK